MRHVASLGALIVALSFEFSARAADKVPVPGDPDTASKEKRKPVEPGFEEEKGGDEEGATEPKPKTAEPKKKKMKGRDTGHEEEDLDFQKPVSVPSQGDNERLIEDMNTATGEVTLGEVVDEVFADVVAALAERPSKVFSPMTIRQVTLGANVVPSYARKLQAALIAQIQAGTEIKMVACLECDTTKTRLRGNQWVIEKGIVSTEELKSVGEKLGVKSFMDVAFGFDPETGVLEMDFRVLRARDGFVLWSDSFRADESTPMLLRSSEAPMKRKDRLKDLEMLLEGRPYYGYVATAGFMILPHNDPVNGDIYGATAGYRIYERFGAERRVMFGLDLTGFLNTSRLAGAVVSAGSWWIPFRPDFLNPELRLGAKAGAFIAGTNGNAAVFQLGAEILLRYRFGLYAYVLFMTKSEFPPNSTPPTYLGGVGGATGISFNW